MEALRDSHALEKKWGYGAGAKPQGSAGAWGRCKMLGAGVCWGEIPAGRRGGKEGLRREGAAAILSGGEGLFPNGEWVKSRVWKLLHGSLEAG